MARGEIDWDAVRQEYEAGTTTNRQLAQRHGCAESAIRDRAARYGWMKPAAVAAGQKALKGARKASAQRPGTARKGAAQGTAHDTAQMPGAQSSCADAQTVQDEDDGPLGDDGIPLKQRRFAEEYIVDLNGTQAAIRAGYSPASAESQASRLLRNAKVAALVEQLRRERSERLKVQADDVITGLFSMFSADITHAVKWGVRPVEGGKEGDGDVYVVPVDSDALDRITRSGIAEITLTGKGIQIKMIDRVRAGAELLKHLPKPGDGDGTGGERNVVPAGKKGLSGLLAEMRMHQAQRAGTEDPVRIYLPDNGRSPDDAST